MTTQKAIKLIETYFCDKCMMTSCEHCAQGKAKEALEKTQQWIPCSERLPTKDEYYKNDGRFIVTDGNRVYQSEFDIYCEIFVKNYFGFAPIEDECVIAWQLMPEKYKVN